MDNWIDNITILGLPAVIVVMAIVQWLKQVGVPTAWAGVSAAICGLIIAGLIEAIRIWPDVATPVARIAVVGILIGLAANGGYSQIQSLGERLAAKKKADEGSQ